MTREAIMETLTLRGPWHFHLFVLEKHVARTWDGARATTAEGAGHEHAQAKTQP